jgi:hypothetical protein
MLTLAGAACGGDGASIGDHALVLLRTLGASELDCLALRARHLVRCVRAAASMPHLSARSLTLLYVPKTKKKTKKSRGVSLLYF